MSERLALYGGSFDLITNGHMWMIGQGAAIFDKLVIAIGVNPDKKCWFTPKERLEMLQESTRHIPNVLTDMFTDKYLVSYARSLNIPYVLRGIRNESDFEFERVMRNVNGDLEPDITTIFLMPPRGMAEVSSSMIKGLIGPEGWENVVARYVPEPVFRRIKERHDARH